MTEPEEAIEARLMETISAALPGIPVVGALSPVPPGDAKESADTSISVYVDLAAEDPDWRFHSVPCDYEARVVVHTAFADDRSGAQFRDTCRAVRAAFLPCLGVNCAALSSSEFAVDSFRLVSTETAPETVTAANGLEKSYIFALKCRHIGAAE